MSSASSLKKSRFAVKGMSCAVCANSVENILQSTKGVSSASVNFADHSVQVKFDSSINEFVISKSISSNK